MSYEIQKIWDRHHKMKRLALLGMSFREIAIECDVTPQTVQNVMSSPLMKKQLELMQAAADTDAIDTYEKIQEMTKKSIKYLEEMMDDIDTPKSLRAKIAMDNLDRAGYPKQTAITGKFVHAHLTAEDINAIKQEAIERGSSVVLNGEFKEVSV